MATVFGGSQLPASSHAPENKYFSDQVWQGMLAEDNQAFKSVAIVLAAVITLGFVGIVSTVLFIL